MTAASRSIGRPRPAPIRLILPTLLPAWAHVARAVLGVWIALYLAYYVQLDSPYWAAATVLVVTHPVRGALFSKSLWRIFGTIVGAVGTVALVAAFPQQPVLFIIGISVWLGVFTFTASLLQYFRSHGAVLAGFTVAVIASGVVEHPETVFDLALARTSAVTIGVLSAAVVSLVFQGSVGEFAPESRLASLMGAVAGLLRGQLSAQQASPSPYTELARIGADLSGMDEVIKFASAESCVISERSTALRRGVAELFGALVTGGHTISMMRDVADNRGGAAVLNNMLTQMAQLARSPDAEARNELLIVVLAAQNELDTLMRDGSGGTELVALAQARELLDRLVRAGRSVGSIPDNPPPASIRLRAWLDWHTALRNGLRAMIAMGLGGLFWIVTAWPTGGAMLVTLGAGCIMLATHPSAATASVDFAKGVVLSVLCAFVCTFGILTHVTGFPLLALSLLPFVAGGSYASTKPRLTPMALPLLIFFLTLVGPTNPIHYNLAAFFNTALAYVCGSIFAALAFRIVLPMNVALNVRRLCSSIGRDVERLGRPGAMQDRWQWEHAQHQKLTRLVGRLQRASPARREAVLQESCAAIAIGSAAIEVRTALAAGSLPETIRAMAERAIGLLGDLRSNPGAAATRSTELSRLLADRHAGFQESVELARVAAAFQRIGTLIQQHERFFRDPGAAFQDDMRC